MILRKLFVIVLSLAVFEVSAFADQPIVVTDHAIAAITLRVEAVNEGLVGFSSECTEPTPESLVQRCGQKLTELYDLADDHLAALGREARLGDSQVRDLRLRAERALMDFVTTLRRMEKRGGVKLNPLIPNLKPATEYNLRALQAISLLEDFIRQLRATR